MSTCENCGLGSCVCVVRPSRALDTQVGGQHYKGMKIQPTEYAHANKLGFLEGNVVKYISRHDKKNGREDVEKAIHYCQMILQMEYDEKLKDGDGAGPKG